MFNHICCYTIKIYRSPLYSITCNVLVHVHASDGVHECMCTFMHACMCTCMPPWSVHVPVCVVGWDVGVGVGVIVVYIQVIVCVRITSVTLTLAKIETTNT